MRFWDSSALIPLYVRQAGTKDMRALIREDADVLVWMLSEVEIWSALTRLRREGAMTAADHQDAAALVDSFWRMVRVVSAVEPVKA